ncbi:MAG: M1 family metallopeptidase [Chitinophagaceae bacterium]
MMRYIPLLARLVFLSLLSVSTLAQEKSWSRADTLRGSITPSRNWWNVLRYDLTVEPDFNTKSLSGKNSIRFRVTSKNSPTLQLDLMAPLGIDSILLNKKTRLQYAREGAAWFVKTPSLPVSSTHTIDVFYSGKVHEAIRAPWDGGWTFTKDSLGRPWMTVTCQGLGASVWYPCKDHQSDEPDAGASLTMVVPDTLVAVANGKLQQKTEVSGGKTAYTWAVKNPINNYNIIPYIGKYTRFSEVYNGEKGKLDITYWVLDYNKSRAQAYLPNEARNTLKAFEHWFGPYPFYEDGYQLIDVPHTGMEHQSAVAYGNHYAPGYRGRDGSGTGWGLKWDFIVIHESGHEWFGNNITTNDLADMWVHEGFTNYSETLFTEYHFGVQAGNEYNAGTRKGIRNDKPIIPPYGVNAQGSGDMYPKGGNMLHSIRHSMGNDILFRKILRGLNKTFYHKTVNSAEVEAYFSRNAGFNYNKVFDQYLRTTQIPHFQFSVSANGDSVHYRYTDCVPGFNLPLQLENNGVKLSLNPGTAWRKTPVSKAQAALLNKDEIEKMYYLVAEPAHYSAF